MSPLARAISEAARNPSKLLSPPLSAEVETGRSAKARVMRAWFILASAVEGFRQNNDPLWAAALTYTVALSIVPILALAFSVLKGFGLSAQLEPVIKDYLALGSPAVMNKLMGLVNNVNATALGSAGGVFLLATVISTMGTIERAFNAIFHVPRSRTYLRKFSDYLSVLFTVPLFIAVGLALTAFLSVRIGPRPALSQITPYLFAWAGFFLLFIFFPYTKVRTGPALLGSFVTAILFQIAQWGYVHFQVGMAKYHAIYGALATVPIFLVWIYAAWSIVLFGAELTAATQRGIPPLMLKRHSPDFPRAAALYAMLKLAEHHVSGRKPATYENLATDLSVSPDRLGEIIDRLKRAGLVAEGNEVKDRYRRPLLLCRAPTTISVRQILEAAVPDERGDVADPRIRDILGLIREGQSNAIGPLSLADLMNRGQPSD